MNTDWLNDYIALIETGSFSKAAERRASTHTAFSRRIGLLEEWAGVKLIERRKPIRQTQEGQIFLEAAQAAVKLLEEVRSQFQAGHQQEEAVLSFTTGRTLASKFFPAWYREVSSRMDFGKMTMKTSGAEHAILRFLAEEAQFLIVYRTPMSRLLLSEKKYAGKKIGSEAVLPVCAPQSREAIEAQLGGGRQPIAFLGYDNALSLKALIMGFVRKKAFSARLHTVFEADNYETLKAMAMEGLGMSWLPQSVVAAEIAQHKLAVLRGEQLQLGVDILLYKNRFDEEPPQVQALWRAL